MYTRVSNSSLAVCNETHSVLWENCVERAQIEGSGFATANYKFSRGENKTCSRRASLVSEDAESAELQATRVGFEILEYTEISCCLIV